MGSVDFGVFLGLERPNYGSILEDTLHCEQLGYHSVWVSDHVIGMYETPGDSRFECWTTSTALLANTTEIMLGQLVLSNPFRHPPLLAKMSATLDAISGGRLILGLGTGWHEGEFKAYGYPYDRNAARVRRLDEAAEIIKRMWTEESPSFEGKYYRIEKAWNSPKPAQRPHPPLLIAGGGEQLTLRTVARHADISNFAAWTGKPEDFRAKNEALNTHCEKVGRKLKEIRRSWAAYCLIGKDATESEMSLRSYTANMQARYGTGGNRLPPLAGTPEQIADQIEHYIDSGVDMFMIRFMGDDFKKEAELFADEVMHQFK